MKIRILENFHLPSWAWHLPILKDFSYEICGDINRYDFWILDNEMYQDLEIFIIHWESVFSKWLNACMGRKSHSKYKTDQWTLMQQSSKCPLLQLWILLQLTFKNLLFIEFWCMSSIKQNYSQLSEVMKTFFLFQPYYLYEARFSSYTSIKTKYY